MLSCSAMVDHGVHEGNRRQSHCMYTTAMVDLSRPHLQTKKYSQAGTNQLGAEQRGCLDAWRAL